MSKLFNQGKLKMNLPKSTPENPTHKNPVTVNGVYYISGAAADRALNLNPGFIARQMYYYKTNILTLSRFKSGM